MQWFHKTHHLVGGTLLIAGTSIGVGMLALPVVTAAGGFIPSLLIYLICWLFMVAFAHLLLEACTWMPKDANMISISRHLLGKKGAAVCWVLYLFLFYCLLTAHIAAGGGALHQMFFGSQLLSTLVYTALFAPVVYLGTRAVDRVNIALMGCVLLTYLGFVVLALPHLQGSLLTQSSWSKIWPAMPVILTAFGFQNLIPTLYFYMERDHQKVRKAIWIGTAIPLALYVLWELLVLGIAPPAEMAAALAKGESAIGPLGRILQNSAIGKISEGFAFFAMSTSFVGIAIAFFDFWADGLNWEKKGLKRIGLVLLTFALPLLFVLANPMIFISALNLAGGIGMILLLGVLPVLFVWSGRYFHGHSLMHQFIPGGKISLSILLLFCLGILASQL